MIHDPLHVAQHASAGRSLRCSGLRYVQVSPSPRALTSAGIHAPCSVRGRESCSLAAALALLVVGCEIKQLEVGGPASGEDGGDEAEAELAGRAAAKANCKGAGGVLDLSGVWAARFETVASVAGEGIDTQTEVVTRYGLATLCQDGIEVAGKILVCAFAQTPIVDPSGECSAQLPGVDLLNALPDVTVSGSLTIDAPGGTLLLPGWEERWGLEPGATPPAEPGDASPVEDATGLVDQDEDGFPGVTLRGDGEVPTISWAARLTVADLEFVADAAPILVGASVSETTQSVLGGPATRITRGQERDGATGEALMARADGRNGSDDLDSNRDGRVSCAELLAVMGTVLPVPRAVGCR